MIEILEMHKEDCPHNKKVLFTYESEKYYDVSINQTENSYSINLELNYFEKPYRKSLEVQIFQDYKQNLECFIFKKGGCEAGIISFNHEEWNNVIRIWDLYIKQEFQRIGIGKRLMNLALNRAKEIKARALVLETQTSNYPAIQFYLNYGFQLIGVDTINYSNTDMEKHEVRLEMGYLLD